MLLFTTMLSTMTAMTTKLAIYFNETLVEVLMVDDVVLG